MKIDRLEIVPYVGLGPLTFGLSRAQSRPLIDHMPATFRTGPYTTNDTDAYDAIGLHLFYDSDDRLRCAMVFGSGSVFYRGIAFLNRKLEFVLSDLAALGLTSRHSDEGRWFDDAGFVLYAPDGIIEAVTVYRRGYCEEEAELARKVATEPL